MKKGKLLLLAVIFILCFFGGSLLSNLGSVGNWLKPGGGEQNTGPKLVKKDIITVLMLGIDARPGEENARSDTMILAAVDTKSQKVALISIPRDTRTKDNGTYKKINSYNMEGGPELAKEKVSELLDTPIDYYVLSNFGGFEKIVDILGGVTIDVEKRMYKPSESINLKPGLQRLDGHKALAYCRWRGDALGDISRTERQQKFLIALANEMMQTKTITKLPRLLPELRKNVETDVSVRGMFELVQLAKGFKMEGMTTQTLPGSFYNDPRSGASYWLVDQQKIPGLVKRLLAGETAKTIEEAGSTSPSSTKKTQN